MTTYKVSIGEIEGVSAAISERDVPQKGVKGLTAIITPSVDLNPVFVENFLSNRKFNPQPSSLSVVDNPMLAGRSDESTIIFATFSWGKDGVPKARDELHGRVSHMLSLMGLEVEPIDTTQAPILNSDLI